MGCSHFVCSAIGPLSSPSILSNPILLLVLLLLFSLLLWLMWERFLAHLNAVGGTIKDWTVNEGTGRHSAEIPNLWEKEGLFWLWRNFLGIGWWTGPPASSLHKYSCPFQNCSTVSRWPADDKLAGKKKNWQKLVSSSPTTTNWMTLKEKFWTVWIRCTKKTPKGRMCAYDFYMSKSITY